jgi:hypothetical protein
LWRFRNNPSVVNLQSAILAEINEQLAKKSLYETFARTKQIIAYKLRL